MGRCEMTAIEGQTHFDPLNRILWQQAIKARLPEVRLRNGMVFVLTYDNPKWPDQVWFTIKGESYAPCGWLNINKVLDGSWLR